MKGPEMAQGVILKTNRFNRELKKHGIKSDSELARKLGMNRSTIGRIRKQEILAGDKFVNRLMDAFDLEYEDIVDRAKTRRRIAA